MRREQPVGINLRAFPRRARADQPALHSPPERLADRGLLVVAAAADRDAREQERFGMGAWRFAEGRVTIAEGLIRDRVTEHLADWIDANPVITDLGPVPRRVDELSTWMSGSFDDEQRLDFRGMAYRGQATVVTADLARFFSLVSVHSAPCRGRWAGGTTYGLAGFGRLGPTGWRAFPHHPTVRLAPLGNFAHRVQFDPCSPFADKRGGVWARMRGERRWRPYAGRFVDVIPPACALDGVDSDELAEHLAAFGREPCFLPAAVGVDPDGAEELTALVAELHGFALQLDADAARWLGGLDLHRLPSGGAIASEIPRRMGVRPPARKFRSVHADVLDAFAQASHGGLNLYNAAITTAPVVDADLNACYALTSRLSGGSRVLTARHVLTQDAAGDVIALLERDDLADRLLDPASWSRLGLTVVELLPDGDVLPVEARDDNGGSRLILAPVRSPERSLFYAWPDVAASVLRTGRLLGSCRPRGCVQ